LHLVQQLVVAVVRSDPELDVIGYRVPTDSSQFPLVLNA
jgi:hypothetical protein